MVADWSGATEPWPRGGTSSYRTHDRFPQASLPGGRRITVILSIFYRMAVVRGLLVFLAALLLAAPAGAITIDPLDSAETVLLHRINRARANHDLKPLRV